MGNPPTGAAAATTILYLLAVLCISSTGSVRPKIVDDDYDRLRPRDCSGVFEIKHGRLRAHQMADGRWRPESGQAGEGERTDVRKRMEPH